MNPPIKMKLKFPTNNKGNYYKTLGTSVINGPMSHSSLTKHAHTLTCCYIYGYVTHNPHFWDTIGHFG